MKLNLLTALILLTMSRTAHSFNYDECRKIFITPAQENIFSSSKITGATSFIPTDASMSSSQFFSSTGECRGIDFRDRTKLEYIASNFEQLKIDTARGNGEYINGLSILYECGEEDKSKLNSLLQSNFELIYIDKNPNGDKYNSPSQVFTEMNGLISSNKELETCSVYF